MLETMRDFLWGPVMLFLLLGTGVFLMVRLRFLPLRNLWFAIRQVFSAPRGKGSGDISSFQSLMTSLATTIGTGNIVGVSAALFAGGPDALFWMLSDIANGLMAIPNLICLVLLSGVVAKETKHFQKKYIGKG